MNEALKQTEEQRFHQKPDAKFWCQQAREEAANLQAHGATQMLEVLKTVGISGSHALHQRPLRDKLSRSDVLVTSPT